ncbi:MAG: 3-deoxy-7-phosphoheptulonate synthase [Planctomycetota bacterium]|nr:MAG: 3-deoxy-7-phosphoheptulonate synthase [Planctomycetota bacterium]
MLFLLPELPSPRVDALLAQARREGLIAHAARAQGGRWRLSLLGERSACAAFARTLAAEPLPCAEEDEFLPLASRALDPSDRAVDFDGVSIGDGAFAVVAGPCAIEGEEQLLAAARAVREAGAAALRGGAFKPRTSPYSFPGLGRAGLELLARARAATGLPTVTEVVDPADVDAVAQHASVLQVGARNMQNYRLLEAVGRAARPVLLKRGLGARLDELLHAAERVLAAGNPNVLLCERGVRSFETATRCTLDLGGVAWLKRRSRLPVLVDPSHAAGDRALVPPLALAAAACGADGLLVEVHPAPERARCDGEQSLACEDFARLMERLRAVLAALGRTLASAPPLPAAARSRV